MSTRSATASSRVRVQKFGTFLSGMVMPNIGVFIAWGLLAAFFIPTGWLPNENLASLVEPIIKYLLPVLIGFTGGRMVHGDRGGAIGAIATMGVVVGADIVMLAGGMIMGPLAAYILKRIDRLIQGRIKPGLEMLVDNFSIGILGFALAIAGYSVVNPIFSAVLSVLSAGMDFLVGHSLLPLTALFVQPAQILFLNNAINHGIMIPLGVEQVTDSGKSILFLVEANGGVWTGVAVAFALFARGQLKRSAPAAALIMFLGGIAEVVFAYVLAKPKTLLGPIAGNAAGLLTLTLLGGGTVGAVSPGSIIALVAMSPRGGLLANLAGYAVALVVTVAVTGLILIADRRTAETDDDQAADLPHATSANAPVATATGDVKNLIFACDAGMGSSVMGVSKMRVKLRKAMLDIQIDHAPVKDIPGNADAVITSTSLADRVRDTLASQGRGHVTVFPVENLLSDPEYDRIIAALREGKTATASPKNDAQPALGPQDSPAGGVVFDDRSVQLGASFPDKWAAIKATGQLMVDRGYVTPAYIEDMVAREKTATVYVGNNVAIPHGVAGSEANILTSGLCVIQVPDGVSFGDKTAYVLVGIAGRDGTHLGMISNVATVFSDQTNVDAVRRATDRHEVTRLLASSAELIE